MSEKIDVLDQGFVRLVDVMGDDAAIVQAARVSYGAGTKTAREDAALIDYLMRNDHTSPFEMVEFKFHVKAPLFVARQWVRHRTASINELSARYSVMADEAWNPTPEALRAQGTKNKQVGDEKLSEDHADVAAGKIEEAYIRARQDYEDLLEMGVARELARMLLPLNTYTEWYWKIDLHNLLRFLKLRLDAHAQQEIREYAQAVLDLVEPQVPATVSSWENHVRYGVRLSRKEVRLLAGCQVPEALRARLEVPE